MGLWTYIARKIKPLLKDEIVNELCTEKLCAEILKNKGIESKISKSVEEGISRLQKEISSASSELKKERKGLVAKVESLSNDINGYSLQTAQAISTANEAMALVSEAQSAADAAKANAEVACSRALTAENIANDYKKSLEELTVLIKKEEQIYSAVDEKIGKGISRAVEESTAHVNEELKKVMGDLRKEYLELKLELLDRVNDKFIGLSDKFSDAITKSMKVCEGKVDGVIEDFNKSKAEVISGFNKCSSDAVADFRKSISGTIAELESVRQYVMKDIMVVSEAMDFIIGNMPHVVYALGLNPQQRSILAELYDQYHGNAGRFKEVLTERYSTINGKKELTPEELASKYAPRVLDELLDYQRIHKLGNENNLREVLRRVDNWYTWINSRHARKNSKYIKKN